jgi:hypothetical protein
VPLPELYVAYNGPGEIGGCTRRFSVNHQGVRIDAEVSIIDIRYESLDDLDASDALAGYSYFQKRKDELELQGMTRDRAFMEARRECIEKGYMKGFIEKEEFLVYKRIFDYDEQLRSEGEAIGEARGVAIGEARGVAIGEARGVAIGEARGVAIGEARGEARGVAMQAEKMLRSAINIDILKMSCRGGFQPPAGDRMSPLRNTQNISRRLIFVRLSRIIPLTLVKH